MLWFDLDNSPHVPLFRPILAELGRREEPFFVTARRHAQTEDLLKLWKLDHVIVGHHAGRKKVRKVLNLAWRSLQLTSHARGKPVTLAMSHGSRTHLLAAGGMLRIPYVWMGDYEFAELALANLLATYILLPSHIPAERVAEAGYRLSKVIRYAGFKEEMYLKDFVPDLGFRRSIGVGMEKVLVTLRPPSVTANYHEPRSEEIFRRCLREFSSDPGVVCLIVNRTSAERALIPPGLSGRENVRLLVRPVDGLQLIWNSDLVVSGGGTMNRESALLGVPTYSIFTGRRPSMDEYLEHQGRLVFIERAEDIRRIPVAKRAIGCNYNPSNVHLASWLTDLILDLSRRNQRRKSPSPGALGEGMPASSGCGMPGGREPSHTHTSMKRDSV